MRRRGLTLGAAAIFTSLFVGACLTPHFDFDDGPYVPADQGGGGAGSGGATPLPPFCSNGKLDANEGETDTDCGGPCSTCVNGKACLLNADCTSNLCTAGICTAAPSCTDRKQNQDETDIDCGGKKCSARCDDDRKCKKASDCSSGVCTALVCAAPTCSDGVENGTETAVDCGGDDCGACLGSPCSDATDCADQDAVCDAVCKKTISLIHREGGALDTQNQLLLNLTFDRTAGARGHRILAVVISALSAQSLAKSVVYGGQAVPVVNGAQAVNDVSTDVSASVYLLDECGIQKAGSDTLAVTMPLKDYSGTFVDAAFLENVDQDFSGLGVSTTSTVNNIVLSATLPGAAWFFGGAGNQGNAWTLNGSSPSGTTTTYNPTDFYGVATLFGPLIASSYDFTWDAGYQNKAAAGVSLLPAQSPATCP